MRISLKDNGGCPHRITLDAEDNLMQGEEFAERRRRKPGK